MTTTHPTADVRRTPTRETPPDPTVRRRPRSTTGQLLLYLSLAYGLSWWPWPLSDLETRPDAALMIPIGPSIAAVVMVLWTRGRPGGRDLLAALLHVRIGRWWLALLLPVLIAAGSAALAVLAGAPAPGRQAVVEAIAAAAISLPLIMVVGGPLGEELGWRGYVLPTLLGRSGPIVATLALTPMWIAFHLPWILNEPEQYGPAWALAILGMALTMTWLYLRTNGSLALAVVFHAVINTSTAAAIQLFPEPDRASAWRIAATLWLLTGLVAASRMPTPRRRLGGLRSTVQSIATRHPVGVFLALALGIGWSTLGSAVALDLPIAPFHLVANFGGLLGSALLVTALVSGRAGVRALLGGALRWRVGWSRTAAALLALPITSVAVAAVTGTLQSPVAGWSAMVASYLAATLLSGVLLFNLWEETAWAGFVQTRLADRHGLVTGALLTAVPFAGIHLPLAFVGHPPALEIAVRIVALGMVAVVFRLLAGMFLAATSGSVLIVAVVHASFNASGSLSAVDGSWQSVVALAVVTGLAGLHLRRPHSQSRLTTSRVGLDVERVFE